MNVDDLKKLVPWQELEVIEGSRELSKVLARMAERIDHIPVLYETENLEDEQAHCYLHYFNIAGSADWYIFEVDMETMEGFGFVTLSGDFDDHNAEFGYVHVGELCEIALINLDLHFGGITRAEIKRRRYGEVTEKE
ncbi:MAG: hypothetical protein FWH12_02290 [Treponema sp.]|nr:hypothetical protein [Treponema sp.]